MSNEGVTLIARGALMAVLIVVTAFVRVLVGPSKRRGFYMSMATIGGMAVGVAAAAVMSPWIGSDVSAISACLGIFVGWAAAWPFVRRIPRQLH
jgi:hypothetical protein